MKETIDTAPIHAAYEKKGHCPLCLLREQMEQDLLTYYCGPSLMEVAVRQQTNERGFCATHWRRLLARSQNRLGLALLLHTHLKEHLEKARKTSSSQARFSFRKVASKNSERLLDEAKDCLICERKERTMARYIETIFAEYQKQPDFRSEVLQAAYCQLDALLLLDRAEQLLGKRQLEEFEEGLKQNYCAHVQKLMDLTQAYAEHFDYRRQKDPWGEEQEALKYCEQFLGMEECSLSDLEALQEKGR